jgi:MFS superfamily sulfate permease-like transporter
MTADPTPSHVPFSDLKHDLFASIVVFLVALPLCMGIAVASGAPPAAGIITGIVGGLVAGALAGCPLQVSGPAAGLSVIVWQYIQTYGMEKLSLIVLLAGIHQMVAAWLQLGQWFRAVSPAVIHGMLSGLGLLILAGQFHIMIDDAPRASGLENMLSIPAGIWKAVSPAEGGPAHQEAAAIGVLTIVTIILWNEFAPKKIQVLPGVLVGVALATAVTVLFDLPISHVKVRDDLLTAIELPTLESLEHLMDTSLLSASLALAFIACVETLLSATAVDHLHSGSRTHYNKELFSQGVGNALCGLLGALPMTGVIVRSSANVQAGARTRASAILHGAWLLLFVSLLPFVLRQIPTACLGAVLVFTGYKLMNIAVINELKDYGRSEVAIYVGTVGAIVATNLLTGVLVGVGLAIWKLLYTTQNLETYVEQLAGATTVTYRFHLMGIATFVSLPKLATALEDVPPGVAVEVHIESLRHIDHACLTLLESWAKLHEQKGGQVILDRDQLQSKTYHVRHRKKSLRDVKWYDRLLSRWF